MRFQREIKGLEARQRLEALVVPNRQALTRLQALLAPSAGSCCTVLYWFFQSSSKPQPRINFVHSAKDEA